MTPDKKTAVLADYRAKKATSAAQLAKLHGLSRSAVYRLLQAENKDSQATPKPANTARTAKADKYDDDNDDAESFSSMDSAAQQKFVQKSERFAEDLGLPVVSDLKNYDDGEKDGAKNDERVEQATEAIFGSMEQKPDLPDEVLDSIFDGPAVVQKTRGRRERPQAVVEFSPEPVPQAVRLDIIQRIIFNVENFGPLLTTIVGPNPQAYIASLQMMGAEELERTLEILERTRSVGNIAAGLKQTFFMVASATEVATSFVGVKARGFTDRLRVEEQQITMIMKELAIENWNRVKSMDSPTARLGVLFCMTLAQTDSVNRLNDVLRPQMASRPVPEAFAEANSDL